MGVYVAGLFICSNEYINQDGSIARSITIATDTDAYRVFMDSKVDASMVSDLQVGTPVRVRCRPYVKKEWFSCLGWRY